MKRPLTLPTLLFASAAALAALPSAAEIAPVLRSQAIDAPLALPSPANVAPAGGDTSAATTQVVVVDVSTLPKGELPALPAENDAPTGVPGWTQPQEIAVESLGEVERPRRPSKRSILIPPKKPKPAKRTEKMKLVSIAPTAPTIDAIYTPSLDATELEAQSAQKMSCGERASVVPVRWESFATTPEGNARLDLRDLWFDSKSCAVGPGPAASVALKAIAWSEGKPWLFAMKSRAGVTLVMPRVSELSSESMVGAPVAMRGDFTRITLPLGRWGSGSIVAQLESLSTAGGTSSPAPVEVGIELVQTMSEKAPTLLVRTRRAPANVEGRD